MFADQDSNGSGASFSASWTIDRPTFSAILFGIDKRTGPKSVLISTSIASGLSWGTTIRSPRNAAPLRRKSFFAHETSSVIHRPTASFSGLFASPDYDLEDRFGDISVRRAWASRR